MSQAIKAAPSRPDIQVTASSWLTPVRLRRQAILLTAGLWLTYAVTISTPGLRDRFGQLKGVDFLQFYTAGSLALRGDLPHLYNLPAFTAESVRRVPQATHVIFAPIYGPQVAVLMAPLAMLPYGVALLMWTTVSAVIYALVLRAVWRICPNLHQYRTTVLFAALGYPAFFNLIAHGQSSALALACFAGAFFALRSQRPILAGVAIGLLIYKPQLGLVSAVVFLSSGEWRTVLGAVVGAIAEISIGWLACGTRVMLEYGNVLRHLGDLAPMLQAKPYQMHSLMSLWKQLLPSRFAQPAYALTAACTIFLACWIWRSRAPLPLRFAGLLLATVLSSPHLYVYDLVILAPALLFLANWILGSADAPRLGWWIYLAYALPLIGPITRYTHVQLSVISFAVLLIHLTHAVVRTSSSPLSASAQ
jgi:hypothetical protein